VSLCAHFLLWRCGQGRFWGVQFLQGKNVLEEAAVAIDISYQKEYVEVRVSGKTSAREILAVIKKMRDRDPHKEISDIWIFSEDSMVPLDEFPMMAESIQALCADDMVGCKSALVASGSFQRAALEFIHFEAHVLPYEVRVFTKREEAVKWIRGESDAG
jgi:hypothetical protein